MKTEARNTNLIAIIMLGFGLLASLGGIDIATLAAVFLIIAPFLVFGSGDWKGLGDYIGKTWIFHILLIAIITYYLLIGFSEGQDISEGMKHVILVPILMPFAAKLILDGKKSEVIMRAIIAAFGFLLIFLVLEAISSYKMYRISNPTQAIKGIEVNIGRAAFIALCLFWPALYCARAIGFSNQIIFWVLIFTAFISTRFGMDLHIAIFLIACIAAMASRIMPRITTFVVLGVPITLVGLAPIIYNSIAVFAKNNFEASLPMSWGRRADMWIYAHNRILEKPLYGWGFDGSRQFDEIVKYAGFEWGAIQMHPHSAPMHIWLEGGIFGAAFFILFLVSAAVLVFNSNLIKKENAWAFNGLMTSIIIAWSLSYSIWEQWLWAVSFFLIVALIALTAQKNNSKLRR